MKNIISLLFILLIFFSCKKEINQLESELTEIDTSVNSLKTIKNQKLFLDNLYDDSQGKVEEVEELKKNYFPNRSKIFKIRKELDSTRRFTAYKAEKYLELYDYPTDTVTYSKKEYYALFFAVLNSNNSNFQIKSLSYIEKQYSKGYIPDNYFFEYLYNIYYLDKGSFYLFDKKQPLDITISELLNEVIDIKKNRNL